MRIPTLPILIFIFCCLASKASYAQEWTAEGSGQFEYHPRLKGHENFYGSLAIANRVYVYFRHSVDQQTGVGWNEAYLTNGVRHRGFTTCMETIYSGPGVTMSANYVLGVNPRGERRERRDITMSPEAWARVTTFRVRAGWCPSNRIARNIFDTVADGVEAVIDAVTWSDGSPAVVQPSDGQEKDLVQVFVASAVVPCARAGSTGGVTIIKTARESCEVAVSRVAEEVESGNACRIYAADAVLNGTPNYSKGCGTQLVSAEQAN